MDFNPLDTSSQRVLLHGDHTEHVLFGLIEGVRGLAEQATAVLAPLAQHTAEVLCGKLHSHSSWFSDNPPYGPSCKSQSIAAGTRTTQVQLAAALAGSILSTDEGTWCRN
jgi:hypothetical protein